MNSDERQLTEEEIGQYLERLVDEWNFRLLTDAAALTDTVLWVESVTVTSYQP